MKKTIYLVHGWGGSSSGVEWFNWLKEELYKKGHKVIAFNMPNTENPKIEEWVRHLEENIKDVDERTYFVGHSIGCQTILRFLEKLHSHKRIGGCVFVAGWFKVINLESEELEIAHPWMNSKIEYKRVLDHCNNFLAVFSDNDPLVPLTDSKIFEEKLGTQTVIEHDKEHFSGSSGIKELPSLLNAG